MNKQEFISEIAEKAGLSNQDAARAVEAFLAAVIETLQEGDEVSFTGFGKFTTQRRAERQGVNPRRPSEKVTIPAATVPKFRAGARLKEQVREGLAARVGGAASTPEEQYEYYAETPGDSPLGVDSEGEPDEPWRRRRDKPF